MSHIKHHFVSGKADGTDATLVKPTNWNEDHDMTTDTDGVVLGRTAGAGAGPVQELPFSAVLPYGTLLPFAGTTTPPGWLICDGSSLLRSAYPGLFAAIGGTYGAVDGAHFSIPDLRGRTIAGVDPTGTRLTTSISPNGNTLGGVGGLQTAGVHVPGLFVNVGAWAGGSYTATGYTTGTQSVNTTSQGPGGFSTEITGGQGYNYGYVGGYHTHGISVSTGGENLSVTINSFGANGYTSASDGGSAVVVQPTLLMNWIIKT